MNPYPEMYYTLFNKITDVIEELKAVQEQAEDIYLARNPEQKVTQIPADHPINYSKKK